MIRPATLVYTTINHKKLKEHYIGWENNDCDKGDPMDIDVEEIRTLSYEDVTLVMLPNPEGIQDFLMMEVSLKYTKGWKLRPKP